MNSSPDQTTSSQAPQPEPNLWADLRKYLKARHAEWRSRQSLRFSRTVRGVRISQLPRGFGPQAIAAPKPEALEPGFDALRVWFLLFTLSATALVAGVQFGGRFGLVLGFIATLVLNLWILFLSPSQLMRDLISWELEGRDTWGLLDAAREAAQLAHIPAPRIALADTDQFFCMSIGLSSTRSTIILSHGLVEKLSPEERRLIVAFETAKIACQWTASATAARGLARLFDWPGLSSLPIWILRLSLGSGRILKIDEWVASHGESRELWARTLWSLDSMMASKSRRFFISEAALQTVFTSEIFSGPAREKVSAFRFFQSKVNPPSKGAAWGSLTEIRGSRYERVLPGARTRIGALIDRFPP